MMNILMMIAFMLLFLQVRGAETDEAKEARLAHVKDHNAVVRDDEVDGHVIDADGVHVYVLIAG